jgi:hypothetical protein
MAPQPLVPLRWYEIWMLRFLVQSPRIYRIVVEQRIPDPISQLEALYSGPSAADKGQG